MDGVKSNLDRERMVRGMDRGIQIKEGEGKGEGRNGGRQGRGGL